MPICPDMSTARLRQVGTSVAVCGRCGASTVLTVWELQRVTGWWHRDRTPATPLARSASCPVCVTTYRIRCTELTAVAAPRRRDSDGEPAHRDWAYQQPVSA